MTTTEWTGGGRPPATIKVNGETVSTEDQAQTLGTLATKYSSRHGIKTFSVYVNGHKADTADGSKTLDALGATEVDFVAKDARG